MILFSWKGIRIIYLMIMHYSGAFQLQLQYQPSGCLSITPKGVTLALVTIGLCSHSTLSTWIITRRRTTLVVTISSSSELVSSSPNSSANSYWKHGNSALLYAALAVFIGSVLFLSKIIFSKCLLLDFGLLTVFNLWNIYTRTGGKLCHLTVS